MGIFDLKPTAQERKMQERLHMRKLYQNLSSLDSAVQYMKSEDFEKGGWFVLAFQAEEIKKIKEDIQFIKNLLTQSSICISNILSLPQSDTVTVTSTIDNEWEPLQTCCWDWQKEAIEGKYDLVFNPHYFTNIIYRDIKNNKKILKNVVKQITGGKYLYYINKNSFLDVILKLRKKQKNKPVHKFDIHEFERFCTDRKKLISKENE